MASRLATRLETFFQKRTDGDLRSIIKYNPESTNVVYVRDDVANRYSPDEIEETVDDSKMESMMAPVYADMYADDHGDLTCLVKCFEEVIEMNFVIDDGVGAAVALDEGAMADTRGLVSDARDIVLEEREI